MEEYESVLCVKNEVFVYRIPARTSNRGYRCVVHHCLLVALIECRNSWHYNTLQYCPLFPLPGFHGLTAVIARFILAGWPLRNPVAASRSSRHQSKNRHIFFARSRSSLVLKPFTVFAVIESLSSIFHLDTTRWEKKNCLIFLLHRHLTSSNECPRVLPVLQSGECPFKLFSE